MKRFHTERGWLLYFKNRKDYNKAIAILKEDDPAQYTILKKIPYFYYCIFVVDKRMAFIKIDKIRKLQ